MIDRNTGWNYAVRTLHRSNDGFLPVIAACPILTGVFDGFSWIRCEGKGSFQNSPMVKEFGDARIAAGESCLVVDLGGCTGMDSTFMGTLAGMATRLSACNRGRMQIAEPGVRNQRSLEDLGLDFLMEINPPQPVWNGNIESVRSKLYRPSECGKPGSAKDVLVAHEKLSELNQENARKFSAVVSILKSEVEEKEKLADPLEKR